MVMCYYLASLYALHYSTVQYYYIHYSGVLVYELFHYPIGMKCKLTDG